MSKAIILVRHGQIKIETKDNERVISLTKQGQESVQQLSEFLVAEYLTGREEVLQPKTIFSSPSNYCQQTSMILSQQLGNLPIITGISLAERRIPSNYVHLVNTKTVQSEQFYMNWNYSACGIESISSCFDRMSNQVHNCFSMLRDGELGIVVSDLLILQTYIGGMLFARNGRISNEAKLYLGFNNPLKNTARTFLFCEDGEVSMTYHSKINHLCQMV